MNSPLWRSIQIRSLQSGVAFAVLWAALVTASLLFQFEPLLALQLQVGDFVFLQEGGPSLGATRTARDDIILVDAVFIGMTESYTGAHMERDLALYRRILEDGPIAVGDIRFKELSKESEELMEGLVALEEKGLVLRHFDTRIPEKSSKVSHSAASVVWMDSPRDLANKIRFQVLLIKRFEGLRETMALRLARAYLGLENPSNPEALQTPQGYQFAPGLLLPSIHRPSKEAPGYFGEYVLWINYLGPPGTFRTVSAEDVEGGRVEPGFFRGKLVIVDAVREGGMGTPASARRNMPYGEIDANAVQTILDRRFMLSQGTTEAIVVVFLLALVGGLLFSQLRPVLALLVLLVLLSGYLGYGTALYRSGTMPDVFFGFVALLGTFVSTSLYRYVEEEGARRRQEAEIRRLRETFGRYVARSVVERILQDPSAVALGGKRQEVTILFADIRGYTTLSEREAPEEVVRTLNIYLTSATRGILAQEGTVDKYMGDAIMAYFNAPLPQYDHTLRAIEAALAMQETLGAAGAGGGPSCGVGIHTGIAIVGNVGSPEIMSYTVIGDAVNVASRLQSNAGPGEILISEGAYDQVRGLVEVEPLEPLSVKGRTVPVPVYRVKGLKVR